MISESMTNTAPKDELLAPHASSESAASSIIASEPANANEATPEKAPQAAMPQQMSLGEKRYNQIVYQGINYWLNLSISMVITDFFLHGKGKNFFHKGVEKSTQALMASTPMKRPMAKWLSEIALGTFSLNSGGNILLIPTKFIEDNKRYWVHKLNDSMGVDQTAPDGHKETADEIYIEQEQPKQSWLLMIGRRVLGWGATTAVGLTLDRVLAKKLPVPHMEDGVPVTHIPGQKIFTDNVVNTVNSVVNAGPTAQRYMGYAALDSIYTLITSKILHSTNGARKAKAPNEIGDDAAPKATFDIGEEPPYTESNTAKIIPATQRSAADIIKAKASNESFAQSVTRENNTPHLQMGV